MNSAINRHNENFSYDLLVFLIIFIFAVSLRYFATYLGYTSDTTTFFERGKDFAACWDHFLFCPKTDLQKVYVPSAYGMYYQYENGLMMIITDLINRDIFTFQKVYAVYFSIIDTTIAFFVFKKFNLLPAILFIIAPASFIISGMHIQIDNVAILYALIGSILYLNGYLKSSIIFFTLSLSIKLIILLFLPILFFYPCLSNDNNVIKNRIRYMLVPVYSFVFYLILIMPTLFSGYVLDNNYDFIKVFDEIMIQTFYFEAFNDTILMMLMSYFGIEFGHVILMALLIYLSVAIIYFFRDDLDILKLFGIYLFLAYLFTPRLHDQYVIWMLVSCFILWRHKLFLIPNILSSVVILHNYAKFAMDLGTYDQFWIFNFRPLHDLTAEILKWPSLFLNATCQHCDEIQTNPLPYEVNTLVFLQLISLCIFLLFIVQSIIFRNKT